MNPFLTLLRKETHELLKWALLMGVLLIAVLSFSFQRPTSWRGDDTVFGPTLDLITTFGFPLIAFTLGFLATILESKGDRWAFLVHRPIAPSRLFLAKLSTSLALYFLVTLTPYLIAMACLPSHFYKPFTWAMALPGLAAILAGAVYLPAAMSISLRNAHRYLPRILPLGPALLCTYYSQSAFEFHHAVLCCVFFFLLTALTAYHAFVTGVSSGVKGFLKTISQGAMVISLLAGLWVLAAAAAWCTQIIALESYGYTHNNYALYFIDNQARVLLLNTQNRKRTATDLSGRPLPDYPGEVTSEEFDKHYPPLVAGFQTDNLFSLPDRGPAAPYTAERRYLLHLNPGSSSGCWWFYLPDSGLIQGFDAATNRHVATLDPNTFPHPDAPSLPPGTPPAQLRLIQNTQLNTPFTRVIASNGVFLVDLAKHKPYKTVFLPQPGETILSYSDGYRINNSERKAPQYILMTPKRLVFIDSTTQAVASELPIPPYFSQSHARMRLLLFGDTLILHASSRPELFLGPATVVEMDLKTHRITKSLDLPILPSPEYDVPHIPSATLALGLGPAGVAALSLVPGTIDPDINQIPDIHLHKTGYPWIYASGIIGAIACLLLGLVRRLSPARLLLWLVSGALLGLPSFLLMSLILPWQGLESCPSCSRKRPVNQLLCPRCKAPFAPPASTGGDVMAPLI